MVAVNGVRDDVACSTAGEDVAVVMVVVDRATVSRPSTCTGGKVGV